MADQGKFIVGPFFQGAGKGVSPGKFGARHGMISVVAQLDLQGTLLQQGKGGRGFAGDFIQKDLADANRKLALELAQVTAGIMQRNLHRPHVSSKRLYEALLDPRNRASNQVGYGVGSPEFLDKSQAKYWRQIDQGYTGHVGRVIQGVWGATLTGEFGGNSKFGPYPIAGPVFSAFGSGNQGRLRPMGRKYASGLLRSKYGRVKGLGTRGVISKPISPEQYFKAGWEEFNAPKRTMEVVKAILVKTYGGVPSQATIRSLSAPQPRSR